MSVFARYEILWLGVMHEGAIGRWCACSNLDYGHFAYETLHQ